MNVRERYLFGIVTVALMASVALNVIQALR